MTDDLDLVRLRELLDKATPGESHCPEMLKPGGCQLHNLQCGYPDCDRKPGAKEAIELLRMRSPTLARTVLDQDARITALLDEIAALKRDNEQHAANYREVVGLKCELQERFDHLATQFTAAEASRDMLAGKLDTIHTAAILYIGGEADVSHDAATKLIERIATIARSAEK